MASTTLSSRFLLDRAPHPLYELHKRRLYHTVRHFWLYIDAQLSAAKNSKNSKSLDDLHTAIYEVKT